MSIEVEVTRLTRTLRAAERNLSQLEADHEPLLANALLILALQRMIARDGPGAVSSVLWRLADAVSAGPPPPPERAIDLSSRQS